MRIFKKTKMLEEKIDELRKELKEANAVGYKQSEMIADLNNKLEQAESDYSSLRDKMNILEEELNILRNERKEIEDKTKEGIDKDAVIVQLIMEKDRLAIENLKCNERLVEKDRMVLEAARFTCQFPTMQVPYYLPGSARFI